MIDIAVPAIATGALIALAVAILDRVLGATLEPLSAGLLVVCGYVCCAAREAW